MIPKIVASIMLTLSLACGFFFPDQNDVTYISKTIWGEGRGCSIKEQKAIAGCILNRVKSPEFPNTIKGVVTAPNQFQGYDPNNPDIFRDIAHEVIVIYHEGGCVIDRSLLYFSGNGRYNTFRDSWIPEEATLFWRDEE